MLLKKEFFDETLLRSNLNEFGSNNQIYLFLVALDFTTINSYLDYEVGTGLGKEINNFLKKQKTYIKTIKLGSKFLYIFSDKVTSQMEKDLDELTKDIWKKNNNQELKQKIVFFVQRKFDLRNFSIENKDNRVISLFDACLSIETQMNKIRGEVQRIIKSKQNLPTDIQKKYSISSIIKNIKESNPIEFKKNIRNKYNLAKSSYLLRESFNKIMKILDTENETQKINLKKEVLDLLFNYVLWIKTQEMLLEIYKVEKIRAFFDSKSEENKIKFEDLKNITTWYNTVVVSNYPYLTQKNILLAQEIKELIDEINKNKNSNKIDLLIDKIRIFSEGFNPQGVFNVPLLRVAPNNETKTFFSRQYSYKFKENAKTKYNSLRKIFKQKFPFVTDELSNFYTLFNEMNKDFIKNKKIVDFVMIFMELDGFNAFNKYMFGNDSDKIYSIIINFFFEILNEMFYKEDFARNCVSNIMGDEFFFASVMKIKGFLSSNLTKIFMAEFNRRIEKLTKNISFVKTKKIKVKIKNISKNSISIVFREPMYQEKEWVVARLGVSTGIVKEIFWRGVNLKEFKSAYDRCNKKVDKIKEKKYNLVKKERELVTNGK